MTREQEVRRSLGTWAARRPDEGSRYVIPAHNIQPDIARQAALMRCLLRMQQVGFQFGPDTKVLDVGSGSGYGLPYFLTTGFAATQLYGVDLLPERVEQGHRENPAFNLFAEDATNMHFVDGEMDIVCEQFCFCHIMDDTTRALIAKEMLRVSSRWIIVLDWQYGSAKRQYNGMSAATIRTLFPGTTVAGRWPAQLLPPVGRRLSRYAPWLYPAAQLLPPLVGARLTLLDKT